jgi:signal transduction histidine kinase
VKLLSDLLQHRPPEIDWDGWRESLQRFAAATRLCVSAYDDNCQRQLGPYYSSKVANLFATSGLWSDGGPGLLTERELVARVIETGTVQDSKVCAELHVRGTPLLLGGRVRGCIVYGWTFSTFGTSLGCERMGRQLGVDGVRLWAEARLESPVPQARMTIYTQLLETMISSTARHAEAVDGLQKLGYLREVFLAGVSHVLRTPLSVIATRIEILLMGALNDPSSIRESLLKMKQHVAEEARLVEDLIEASRTRTGQLPVDKRPSSLDVILHAAISAVLPHAETKQVRVEYPAMESMAELVVLADQHRLQQVFWNLLSNAVKFTPSGGRVTVMVNCQAQMCSIVVKDTGRGIDEAMLPYVFEPFIKQRDGNEHGLGLGLSIARHIIEMHDGLISAESAGKDAGTTFHVQLPLMSGQPSEPARARPTVRPGPADAAL